MSQSLNSWIPVYLTLETFVTHRFSEVNPDFDWYFAGMTAVRRFISRKEVDPDADFVSIALPGEAGHLRVTAEALAETEADHPIAAELVFGVTSVGSGHGLRTSSPVIWLPPHDAGDGVDAVNLVLENRYGLLQESTRQAGYTAFPFLRSEERTKRLSARSARSAPLTRNTIPH
jgi:hypothetical protein